MSQALACRQGRRLRPIILELCRKGIHIALIGVVVVMTLALIARPFLGKLLLENYDALYRSYKQPVRVVVEYYVAQYGLVYILLSALGYTLGLATRTVDRTAAGFLCLFGAISFVEWAVFPGQLGRHYTTHFTLPLVLGVSCLVCTVCAARRLATGIGAGAIGLSLTLGCILGLTGNQTLRPRIGSLFPEENGPLVRHDVAEIERLIDYLRVQAKHDDPIYVAAASGEFNDDILRQGERQIYGSSDCRLRLLGVPHVDSRDTYPNEPLDRARFVVVADPLQVHLNPREQDVVGVVHAAFMKGGLLAEDFERLPVLFQLDGSIAVCVYQRVRRTSLEKAILALTLMRREIRPRPAGQDDWIVLHPDPNLKILKSKVSRKSFSWLKSGKYTGPGRSLHMKLGPMSEAADLVYLGVLPEAFRVTGRFDVPPGVEVTFRIITLDAEGKIIHYGELFRADNGTTDFSSSQVRMGAQFIAIKVQPRVTGQTAPATFLEVIAFGCRAGRVVIPRSLI